MIWLQAYLSTCYLNDIRKHLYQTCVCPVSSLAWSRDDMAENGDAGGEVGGGGGGGLTELQELQMQGNAATDEVGIGFLFHHVRQWYLQLEMSEICWKPSALLLILFFSMITSDISNWGCHNFAQNHQRWFCAKLWYLQVEIPKFI